MITTTPREHRLNWEGKNMYKYNKVVCLNRRPPTQKVASSSLAETNILIFNFSFSSLESKNYVRKTDMCFVFWGKDPTGNKFFCKVIWLSKLLSTFQFGVVWAMNSLFTATFTFLSAYESDSLTLPVNKSPVVLFSYAHSKIPKEKTEGLRRRLSEEGYYG